MGLLRNIVRAFTSKERWAAIEAESKSWMIQCPDCNHEKSIWDMGGMRYEASDNKKTYMRCVQCGKRSWHSLHQKTQG